MRDIPHFKEGTIVEVETRACRQFLPPRLGASACPRHPGDAQVKNEAKLRALLH